jgi:DNA-binding Lrp family transcriptional regulator
MFEAKAILNCVYDTCHPFFDNSSGMKPGQVLFEVVSIDNSARCTLRDCQMKTVTLTLDAGAQDLQIRQEHGVTSLRRHRLERICTEAFQQDGLLTVEDIANRLLNCGERTVVRDIKSLKESGIILPMRSTVKDMGRSITHRSTIVRYWLQGKEFSEISVMAHHSIEAIANYVDKFKRVVYLAKDNHEINTIAFLVKISPSLAQQYYDMYCKLDIVHHRRDELEGFLKKTTVQSQKNLQP